MCPFCALLSHLQLAIVGSGARSSDDAHDTFTKTFNFIQMSSKETKVREAAAKVLEGDPVSIAIDSDH